MFDYSSKEVMWKAADLFNMELRCTRAQFKVYFQNTLNPHWEHKMCAVYYPIFPAVPHGDH